MNLKYSRQREAIKEFLMTRNDHPTADVVYMNVREEFPNISLGTVYRNLTLLSDIGEIMKLNLGDGADHFDGNTKLHYHFVCTACHCVMDLDMTDLDGINETAGINFSGRIDGHNAHFYGLCKDCIKKSQAHD
ncbi:MAG: transcriptional repressor [Lachnospiraceae bacterium]